MSYQVIARKYRPQRFADVIGQEHVTQTLANAIAQNRIAHAYLFCGPRGTGKTTIARIFAKCLNCTDGPKVDFAEDDPRCLEITEGRAIDVLEIDGASNNGVEQVRELRETVKYAPASSKFKIYIIDEVHMLTTAAFNALLKTLEEPPAHVKFLFATTDPEKVLPTILSRCQRFDLRRIPVSLITKHLSEIALKEKVDIDAEALHAVARGADGGMRDAESALDQLISFCGTHIVEKDVLSMFGLTARSQVVGLAQAVILGNAAGALKELSELARHGKDLGRLLSDLLHHFRNLLIYRVSKGDLAMLEVSEVEAASLKEQGGSVDTDTLTRVMEVFTEAEGRLRDATSKKIFIEVTLLKAIQATQSVSLDDVLKQLNKLRAESQGGTPSATAPISPAPAPRKTAAGKINLPSPLTSLPEGAANAETVPSASSAPKPGVPAATLTPGHPSAPVTSGTAGPAAPVIQSTVRAQAPEPRAAAEGASPAPAVASGGVIVTEDELMNLWREILEGVGRASPFTKNYLIEAHPVAFTKNVFTVGFDPEFAEHIDLVNNSKTHSLLQTKLAEAGHPHAQIRMIRAERSSNWTPPPPPAATEPATRPPAAARPASIPAPSEPGSAPASAATATNATNATNVSSARREKVVPAQMNAEEFKNDPLIQKALEIFKGRIVEVRA